MIPDPDRRALYAALESMPDFLTESLGGLSVEEATVSIPAGSFSPVEQCWHLADLERDGFSVRIRRLLEESNPLLEDFDGDRLARERQYRQRSLPGGIDAFRRARIENLTKLRAIAPDQWARGGTQEGAGTVSLSDIPAMMANHDASHRKEIQEWLRLRREMGTRG